MFPITHLNISMLKIYKHKTILYTFSIIKNYSQLFLNINKYTSRLRNKITNMFYSLSQGLLMISCFFQKKVRFILQWISIKYYWCLERLLLYFNINLWKIVKPFVCDMIIYLKRPIDYYYYYYYMQVYTSLETNSVY